MTWLSSLTSLSPEALKALGGLLGAAVVFVVTYLVGRLKEARKPTEPTAGRIALDPADRDLGFTLVRSVTDLTRGLHDHAERLREHGERLDAGAAPVMRRGARRS